MNWYYRWKAKRQLRKAAALIELLASELPSSVLKQIFPEMQPYQAANYLAAAARRLRRI